MSACSSEFNFPHLDAGVVGDGDQRLLVDPGQAADMVQPVSFCKQHKSEKKDYLNTDGVVKSQYRERARYF